MSKADIEARGKLCTRGPDPAMIFLEPSTSDIQGLPFAASENKYLADYGAYMISRPNEDVEIVVKQLGCSREVASSALHEAEGDVVKAVMKLTAPAPRVYECGIEQRDVDLVALELGWSQEDALATLIKHKGDIVDAIEAGSY